MSDGKGQTEALLTDRQVASAYGIHRVTVWKWSRQGRIPKPRNAPAGKRWLKSEIEEHLHSLTVAEQKEMAS